MSAPENRKEVPQGDLKTRDPKGQAEFVKALSGFFEAFQGRGLKIPVEGEKHLVAATFVRRLSDKDAVDLVRVDNGQRIEMPTKNFLRLPEIQTRIKMAIIGGVTDETKRQATLDYYDLCLKP